MESFGDKMKQPYHSTINASIMARNPRKNKFIFKSTKTGIVTDVFNLILSLF